MTTPSLWTLAILWLVIASAFIIWRWLAGRGVGLVVSIILGLSGIHWIAATLYLLPWYQNFDRELVTTGLWVAVQGLCAFCLGAVLASRAPVVEAEDDHHAARSVASFAWAYIVVGIIMYAFLWPRVGRIASLGALVAAGSSYIVLGICLQCWRADAPRLVRWLGASTLLPVVTILTQGYLSYGLAALAAVAAFIAELIQSRRKLLLAGLAIGYVTMSFYVTYMRDRAEIRDAVWSGAAANRRIDLIGGSVQSFEWFDPSNDYHLERIDERLNQDYFVGMAVDRLRKGVVPFGDGETVKEAFLALLPRAFWPDKGVVAGSTDIVSRFTGLRFMEGTSVGVGLVMEMFVNFGAPGVWLGFALFGAVLMIIDERARRCLEHGDAIRFALWYLPGSALLQLCGGSLVDATAAAGAGVVSVLLVNAILTRLVIRRSQLPAGTGAPGPAAAPRMTPPAAIVRSGADVSGPLL